MKRIPRASLTAVVMTVIAVIAIVLLYFSLISPPIKGTVLNPDLIWDICYLDGEGCKGSGRAMAVLEGDVLTLNETRYYLLNLTEGGMEHHRLNVDYLPKPIVFHNVTFYSPIPPIKGRYPATMPTLILRGRFPDGFEANLNMPYTLWGEWDVRVYLMSHGDTTAGVLLGLKEAGPLNAKFLVVKKAD